MSTSSAETVYFIAKDYRYFSNPDRLNWFFDHVSSQKPIIEVFLCDFILALCHLLENSQAEDDLLVAYALSEEGDVYSCDTNAAKQWGLTAEREKVGNERLLSEAEVSCFSETEINILKIYKY